MITGYNVFHLVLRLKTWQKEHCSQVYEKFEFIPLYILKLALKCRWYYWSVASSTQLTK